MRCDVRLQRMSALAVAVLACVITSPAKAQTNPFVSPHEIRFQNKFLTIHYHRQTGLMDIEWRDGHRLVGIASGARLADGQQLSTTNYSAHELDKPQNTTGEHEYTIRSSAPGQPDFLQHLWLYDGKPWIAIEAELDSKAAEIGTRHFDAVVLKGDDPVQIPGNTSLRILHVPFDNDMWFRYNSVAASDLKPGQLFTSDEVTAIYDNASRQALILGSITHDTWKTAIEAHAADGQLTDLDIYGGIRRQPASEPIRTTRSRTASCTVRGSCHHASLLGRFPTGVTGLKPMVLQMRLSIRLSNGLRALPWDGIAGLRMAARLTMSAI